MIDRGKRRGKKAFHVGRASSVEPAVALRHAEGIEAPALPIDGYHIRMSRKHNSSGLLGPDGGIEIGFPAGLMVDPQACNSSLVEKVLDILDELKIAVAARRVESNEIADMKDLHEVADTMEFGKFESLK